MTLVEARSVSLSSSGLVKMEERKRPASYENDDVAPPHKRQATANVNGVVKAHQDPDMPGKDELEVSLTISYHPSTLFHVYRSSYGSTMAIFDADSIFTDPEIPERCYLAPDARI